MIRLGELRNLEKRGAAKFGRKEELSSLGEERNNEVLEKRDGKFWRGAARFWRREEMQSIGEERRSEVLERSYWVLEKRGDAKFCRREELRSFEEEKSSKVNSGTTKFWRRDNL